MDKDNTKQMGSMMHIDEGKIGINLDEIVGLRIQKIVQVQGLLHRALDHIFTMTTVQLSRFTSSVTLYSIFNDSI
ncbi:hypothetical protein [Dethiosulfatarculus sandiegensis]|uniref:Uncharacterized protein n=1 Tax=Dethiosulfatarculus sandiegensis TaxID=1429043 RepID=A0A0D2HQA0_9BACT|nr:hypothetical protein [Dethiosulfatarculus sandiegensis]KIX12653.1 hypothetical protein X474_18080 [Dethiosulfatarculus sandiegensis]